MLPFEKRAEFVAKGRPLLISAEEWTYLSGWKKAEKGEEIQEGELLKEATKLN